MVLGITPLPNVSVDEICRDQSTAKDKAVLMDKSVSNSLFYSMAESLKYMGGILLAAGLGIIGANLQGVSTLSSAMTAIQDSSVGLTFLAGATALTAVGITAQFIASRHYHNNQFDQFEISAQHTAKYLAKELQQAQGQQFDNLGRADGKNWADVVSQVQQTRQL